MQDTFVSSQSHPHHQCITGALKPSGPLVMSVPSHQHCEPQYKQSHGSTSSSDNLLGVESPFLSVASQALYNVRNFQDRHSLSQGEISFPRRDAMPEMQNSPGCTSYIWKTLCPCSNPQTSGYTKSFPSTCGWLCWTVEALSLSGAFGTRWPKASPVLGASAESPARQRKAAAHTSQQSPQENKHTGDGSPSADAGSSGTQLCQECLHRAGTSTSQEWEESSIVEGWDAMQF